MTHEELSWQALLADIRNQRFDLTHDDTGEDGTHERDKPLPAPSGSRRPLFGRVWNCARCGGQHRTWWLTSRVAAPSCPERERRRG